MRASPAFLLLALAACAEPQLRTLCASDDECGENRICDLESGSCRCANDVACGPDEYCNGRTCQRRVGCDTTLDCPEDTFCDLTTGRCLERDRCTTDVQCQVGQICDTIRFECVPGCRDAGDCLLRQVCRCENDAESCAIGACEGNLCDDDSFCHYGELCEPDAAGEKHCVRDGRGPYCEGCQLTPGSYSRCPGDGPNFCLLDRKVTFRRTYCGVDCSEGQRCPWGYTCRNILVLTGALCGSDADCSANGPTCASDADCPGARCDPTSGRCGGKCSFNEDSKQGFCTCSADSECPRDTCDAVTGRCAITRRPCSAGGNECERAIYCVNLGTRAACLIGRNCVPEDGLQCEDVRPPR